MSSPIETRFLDALVDLAPRRGIKVYLFHRYVSMSEPPLPHKDDVFFEATGHQKAEMIVFRQAHIEGYKLDFFVAAKATLVVPLAVECDGHDWHERTQQQAAYDRARDRHLLKFGIPTIRFTGSEIHRDADQCAGDMIEVLMGQHDALLSRVKWEAEDMVTRAVAELDSEKGVPEAGG